MFNQSIYYRFLLNVHVLQCVNQTKQYDVALKTAETSWTWSSAIQHYIKKYGGEGMAETFRCLFCTKDNKTEYAADTGCNQKQEWQTEVNIFPPDVVSWIYVIIVSILFLLLIRYFLKHLPNVRFQWRDLIKSPRTHTLSDVNGKPQNGEMQHIPTKDIVTEPPDATKMSESDQIFKGPSTLIVSHRYLKRDSYRYTICPTVSDVGWFLKNTVDFFFLELDKFLICQNIPSNIPVLRRNNTTVASPRLDSARRNRVGSSPALSSIGGEFDEADKKKAIREFQEVILKAKMPYYCDVDGGMIHNYGGHVKTLMEFYVDNCAINYDQWYVASLVVNYSLTLLEKELGVIGSMHGLRFVNFSCTGSMKKGLKCFPVNQFDIHMVIQGVDFSPCQFIDQNYCDNIPPGKVLLCAKQTQSARAPWVSKCLKSITINGNKYCCISALEVLSVAEELLDRALQRLYTETRSLIDRLPFKIQRSATPEVTLSIETKNLIGLNLPEIKMRIVPSFPVAVDTWLHPVHVYAVPPWINVDFKRKPTSATTEVSSNIGRSDVLWNLSLGELESFYLEKIDQKMEMAGVHSCHRVCLSILKRLFTSITKKSLLDRGEVPPYALETIVYHLLLESSPQFWNFDKLQDRISDCMIFLEQALQNCRLPNFFVNNLHLEKRMPVIKTWSFLFKGRQENLFSDMGSDVIEKTQHYIKSRLGETGLRRCINEVYSPEMWEYEFFLF